MSSRPPDAAETPWDRVERVFREAVALPESERDAFLHVACLGEPALLAEVRSLLAADAEASAFFDRPTGALPALLDEDAPPADVPDLPPGTRLGPYALGDEIGRGGMGTVYRAHRADGLHEQPVAVKVVRRGLDTADVLARFRRERALLARLAHPGIARLLDGGSTPDGRPYLVMELAEGEPITAFADARRLGLAERLRLLLQACDAVAYAHRRLVVHRDLKPANVLVTEDRTVKLLDFGVAKLLDPDASGLLGEEAEALTRTSGRLYTPEYAAPEQVTGALVTTATDVYALGVMLFELLAGRRPGPVPVRPSQTAREPATRHGEAIPAATVAERRGTTPERLRRALTGDLDRIVLRALHLDPERRYPSAEALAEDVQRYLDGLPVRARPDSVAYRAGKFVRRHRWGVAAGVGMAALLLAFTLALVVQQRSTALERDRAEATVTFLRTVLAGANAIEQGRGDVTVAEMLGTAARRTEAELTGLPDVQARLLLTIGEAYAGLMLFHEAEPALRRAVALLRTHGGATDPDLERGLRTYAHVLTERGAIDSAAVLHREALALHDRIHGPRTASAIEPLVYLAWTEKERARYDEAERLLRDAIARGAPFPNDSTVALATSRARSALGVVLMRRAAYAEAEALERAVLATRERWLGPSHPLVALSLSNLAKIIEDGGGPLPEALALTDRALAARRAISGDSSLATITSRSNRTAVLRGLGRHGEAVEEGARAYETARAVFGANHSATAYAQYNLALALHAAGGPGEAERHYREALAAHEALWGREHPYTAYVLVPLARLRLDAGDAAEAERLARPAVAARRRSMAPGSRLLVEAEAVLVEATRALGSSG